MNTYRISKRKALIVAFIIICTVILGSIIWSLLLQDETSDTFNPVDQNELTENDDKELLSKEVKEDNIVTGDKVLEKYLEIKNQEYAFLVATNAFLEQDKEELVNWDEILYIKYILSKQDQGVVENIYTINGRQVPLAFINYNHVLDDTCLFQGFSLPYYEARYGFIKDSESSIYGDNIEDIFPLIQSKKENIFTIYEESSFLEKLIYNNEGTLLGYAYIEQ